MTKTFIGRALAMIAVAFGALGCEKDDICDVNTPGTPRLFLDFRYFDRGREEALTLNDVYVFGIGNPEDQALLPGTSATDQIALPLPEDGTEARFLLRSSDFNGLTDTIIVNFTAEPQFISKACGFRTVYSELDIQIRGNMADSLSRTALDPFDDPWGPKVDFLQSEITVDPISEKQVTNSLGKIYFTPEQ